MTKTTEVNKDGDVVITTTMDNGVVMIRTIPAGIAKTQLETLTAQKQESIAKLQEEIVQKQREVIALQEEKTATDSIIINL